MLTRTLARRLAAPALLLTCLCMPSAAQRSAGAPSPDNVDWTIRGGDDEASFSPLESINSANVAGLDLAWSLDLDQEHALQATPLVVGGTLYFTGTHSAVYAVDAVTGKQLWRFDPRIWEHAPQKMRLSFPGNKGVAYENGRIFTGTFDGRLIALDAKTGAVLWTTKTVPDDSLYYFTGSPRVFNGKVLIGNGGGDYGARGFVTAYDAATGNELWRFYTVPGKPEDNKGDAAMEAAAKTWNGEYWKTGTGGTVWHGMTFDRELNRVYLGVGNSGPYDVEKRSPGGGDNLYLASMVAIDADTGKYVWHYQVNPREAWDYKATANMVMATIPVDGQPRKVLMQAPTNGFFYVLDRQTGKLLSAEKLGKVTWADRIDIATGRPVERPNIRYETGDTTIFPSMLGAHNWQDMAYSAKTGLVYVPYMQLGMRFTRTAQANGMDLGGMSVSLVREEPLDGKGALIAWDPATQKQRWRVQHDSFWNGGALVTGGNLVFQGTGDGWFSAYDAASGKRLWRFNAGMGILASPVTYKIGGKQYVSILAGYGASGGDVFQTGWKYHVHKRRLYTFVLGGKGKHPPIVAPDFKVHALDDAALTLNEDDVKAGAALYGGNCMLCHGQGTVSVGAPGPDLRESAITLDFAAMKAVMHDGVLIQNGMPRFNDLSDTQIRQIQAYIRAKAREALGLRKPEAAPVGMTRG